MNQTLRSYCTSKYKEYIFLNYKGSKKYFNFILKKSGDDPRLALIAQSYYYSKNRQDLADKFTEYTGEKYATYEEFASSDNKYVYQFSRRQKSKNKSKVALKKIIETIIDNEGLTLYKISKEFGISKSKLYAFFKQEQYNVFSTNRLIEINKTLNQAFKK